MHSVVLLPAIAASSAWAWAAEGYTETLSSTASTLSALLKSGLWTFVGAILATRAGMSTHEASCGDHGVTRVGTAAAPPDDHPEGRSDSWRSAAVPRTAVCGSTAAVLGEDDVAGSCRAGLASASAALVAAANAPLPAVRRLTSPPASAAAKIPTNVHLTARRQCSIPCWAMCAPPPAP